VLGDPAAVRRFLADGLQRFGGSLTPAKGQDSVFMLSAGNLKPKLQDFAAGGEFPMAITFDRRKDDEALYLGRTSPLVSRVCDAVLGEAFSLAGDERFARAGAMFTDEVTAWTALMLLRFRYRLVEETEEFAEEIVLAALERISNGVRWLEPHATAGRELAEKHLPRRTNYQCRARSGPVEEQFRLVPPHPRLARGGA